MSDNNQNVSDSVGFMTDLRQLLEKAATDRQYNMTAIAKDPDVAAMMSKLRRPLEDKRLDPTGESDTLQNIYPGAMQISRQVMSRVEDNENAFRLFPDLELAAQIIISSIMSPKDMLQTDLNFKIDAPEYPQTFVAAVADLIKKEMIETYGLEDEVYDILREALFTGGSHTKLILPEAAVDHVINSDPILATESISTIDIFEKGDVNKIKPLGILGNPHRKAAGVVSALESIFAAAPGTDYDETLYVDQEEPLPESEIFVTEKVVELAKKMVKVTDNPHFMKVPELASKYAANRVREAMGGKGFQGVFATESEMSSLRKDGEGKAKKLNPKAVKDMLYKGSSSGYKPFTSIPGSMSLRRRSVGRPLVMNLSAESVIPIYRPGDYKNHIDYFIATDIDGNPVTLDSTLNEQGQNMSGFNRNDKIATSASSMLTERATKNIMSDNYTPIIQDMATLYSEVIERDLVLRLTNGIYHQEVEIGKNLEIYRVMFTRALQSKMTRLVYVPGEYVTYFAFKYHRNGVGRSYLDDLSNIIGMRAMALFSTLWAKVRRSISTVKTTIKFDPKDPDPVKTLELVRHFVARSRQQYFPNGLRRVADFTDWVQSAGIEIGWENHPKIPNMSLDFEAKNTDHVLPDDSLDETLRRMSYMHFGLSPETVDSAARTDFATTVQQQGVLFSKRIMMLGKTFGIDCTDYTRKICRHDETLRKKIVDLMVAHKSSIMSMLDNDGIDGIDETKREDMVRLTNAILNDLIERVKVSVPEPDTTSLTNMKTEIENYEQIVDKALDYIASDKCLPSDIAGEETASFIQNIREVWKATLMRRFLNDNGIAQEAFDIAAMDGEGLPSTAVNELTAEHSKVVMTLVADLISRMSKAREAADLDQKDLGATPGDAASSSSSYDDSSNSSGDDNTGLGGFDEVGGDFDDNSTGGDGLDLNAGGSDNPPEEETV